jgi:transcriptional regulator with XRE-family HTH domain
MKAIPTTVANPSALGKQLSSIRARRKWTLREMSRHTGIPVSTLSKVEHDRSTLSYDKLVRLSRCLDVRVSEFFVDEAAIDERTVTARRSIGVLDNAVCVNTKNYDYYYLCPELLRKRMIPILMQVRAQSAGGSRELIRHTGEEFVYVLKGCINVVTEFYDPVILDAGESIYLDGNMGHAYLRAEGCVEAKVLALSESCHDMSSPEPRNFAGVSL